MSYAPGFNPPFHSPPTGLGQASAPSLSLDFLIFKAEISIPAYLTEGDSN